MGNEIFVDTGGLYALLVCADDGHKKACEILRCAADTGRRFITTDYILDESATLLRSRGHTAAAVDVFESILSSGACRIEWMDRLRFEKSRTLFINHHDKKWSFTDCFSFVVMKEFRLRDALSKDRHFAAAGFHPLLG